MNRLPRFICTLSLLSVLLTAAAICWSAGTDSHPVSRRSAEAGPLLTSIAPADHFDAGTASRMEKETSVRSLLEQTISQFASYDDTVIDRWNSSPLEQSPTGVVAASSLQVLKVRWQL